MIISVKRFPLKRILPRSPSQLRWLANSHALLILAVVLIAVIARIVAASQQSANLDEGVHLADADLFLRGFFPFRDFMTREPLFLVVNSASLWLFGPTLFGGRMAIALFSGATTFMVYLIGKELYGRHVGLVSGALFGFSAFPIFWGSIVKTEPIGAFFVSATIYFLIPAFRTKNLRIFFIVGACLGLALLSRRTAIVFVPVGMLLLTTFYRNDLRLILKSAASITGGVFVTFGIPIGYLMSEVGFRWLWNALGTGEGLLAGSQPVSVKLQVLYSASTILLPLFLLSFLFIFLQLKKKVGTFWAQFVAVSLLFIYLTAVAAGSLSDHFGFGILYPNPGSKIYFYLLLTVAATVTVSAVTSCDAQSPRHRFSNLLVLGWFGGYAFGYVFYAVRSHLFVDYFSDMMPVMSVMSAVAIVWIYSSWKKVTSNIPNLMKAIAFGVFFAAMLYPYIAIFSPANPYNKTDQAQVPALNRLQRLYSPASIKEVANYLVEHVEDEEVITSDAIFALTAGKRVFHNLNRSLFYIHDSGQARPVNYDPHGLFPSISELVTYIDENQIEYVVEGLRTRQLLDRHPQLNNLIKMFYEPVAQFNGRGRLDSVTIHRRVDNSTVPQFTLDSASQEASWEVVKGEWILASNLFSSLWGTGGELSIAAMNAPASDRYMIEADIQFGGDAGFIVHYENEENYYYIRMVSPRFVQLLQVTDGIRENLKQSTQKLERGKQYHLRVIRIRDWISVSMDGKELFSIVDPTTTASAPMIAGNDGSAFSNVRATNDPSEILGQMDVER